MLIPAHLLSRRSLLIFAAFYLATLVMPIAARADTFCITDTFHQSGSYSSPQHRYTECVPVNLDKDSYTPGSAVTVSGSYPYYIENNVQNFANSYSLSTPSGLAHPVNVSGNYSYSFTAPAIATSTSLIAIAVFPGYTDSDSYDFYLHSGCVTSHDNGCTKIHATWSPNQLRIRYKYTVACSSNQIANSDGTCSTPNPPTATLTANGSPGSITVPAGTPVSLSAAFSANSPDALIQTKITDGSGLVYGGSDATNPRTASWGYDAAISKTFYARGASTNYGENYLGNLSQVTVNVTDPACTPPTASITANGTSNNLSIATGQPVHLSADFAAAAGDTLTFTAIGDYQNNYLSGGQKGSGYTPRTYDWTPGAEGSYVFYARAGTPRCPQDNYAQVTVTATDPAPPQCPAGQTPQTNGGVTGCCPANQTLQANGQCLASPNPPTATITANGVSGSATATVGTVVNLNATFTASSGDTLTTTGIADYQDAWLSGGTGATSPRTYSWTPTLAGTYSFNARMYTSAFPSPTCFNGNCDYATVTITASCPSNQTQQSDGSCVTAGPPTATLTANGQSGTVNVTVGQSVALHSTFTAGVGDTVNSTDILNYNDTQSFAHGTTANPLDAIWTPTVVGSYGFNTRVGTTNFAPSDKASVTLNATCAAGETQQANGTCAGAPSVTASLKVGTYDPNIEGYSCTAQSATINSGDSVMMCWACTGATSNTSTNFSTGGQLSGQTVLSPSQTTSYSLQCANQSTSANASALVNVIQTPPPPPPPPSSVTISANPTRVRKGETTKLAWSGQNVNSCKVTDDKGNILSTILTSTNAFTTDPINSRTIFTISCVGKDGKNPSTSVTVDITPSFIEF